MKVIFMGTADFAVPSLKALKGAGHEIALVVAQPDRPKGRGQHLQAPPLKRTALELGLEIFQPEKIKEAAALERLCALGCDALCVVAYGQLLPQRLLDLPKLMAVNVHASLLPKYRGAAPIEWALARGETESGVALQRMALKMDAGGVLLSETLPLGPGDDAASVTPKLAEMGASLLVQGLELIHNGKAVLHPQDEARASYAPLLKKPDGALDFSRQADELFNLFRGFKARPGVYAAWQGETLKIHALTADGTGVGKPGAVLALAERGFQVACGKGSVWLEALQGPGQKPMPAADWARGRKVDLGAHFSTPIF